MFANRSIKQKTMTILLLSMVFLILAGLIGYTAVNKLYEDLEKSNRNAHIISELGGLTESFQRTRINLRDAIEATNNQEFQNSVNVIKELREQSASHISTMEKITKTPEFLKLIDELKESRKDYGNVIDRVLHLKSVGSTQEAFVLIHGEGKKLALHEQEIIDKMNQFQSTLAEKAVKEGEEIYSYAIYELIVSIIIAIAVSAFLGMIILRSIMESIHSLRSGFEVLQSSDSTDLRLKIVNNDELAEVSILFNQYMEKLDKIAQQDKAAIDDIARIAEMMAVGFVSCRIKTQAGSPGVQQAINGFNTALSEMEKATTEISRVMSALGTSDFAVEFETGKYSGELGGMMTSLQGLSESVGDFMALLSKNGMALNHGATTLSSASNDLSTSSNTQASSLEETAAAIEELTSNISANSQKATEMADLARETEQAASQGKALADTTVASMNEISKATQAINEAVNIIENIAFQTNILSLNAAVEAATAGEAGKGFAVVAQEVRNLANRSADAASQIKELAELANVKSKDGLSVSENMMKGFDVINQKITQTTHLVQDVANGSREQMAGINQINSAVAQLDQMTQQNASLANDVSRLSEEILSMSETLSNTAAKTKYRKESEGRVCRIDMMFETNKLKFDHVNFKNNNFGKLKDNVSAWTVTNETQCDLGKWIQAHSNESYARTPEWSELLTNHAHVHQKVQEFVNREKSGAQPSELQRIAKEIEHDTTKVFASLNKIRVAACNEDMHSMPVAHTPRPAPTARPAQKTAFAAPAKKPAATHKPAPKNHDDDVWESF